MKFFVFFGLPGAGKSYAGEVAAKYFAYHVYEGDNDLTKELDNAFRNQKPVTDDMRDIFFHHLIESIKKLQNKFDKLIITQTFIKEKYREQFLEEFPDARFVLINTDTSVREDRLARRKAYPLDIEYARKMVVLFENPIFEHEVIRNTLDGENAVKEQLEKILI